MLAFELLLRKNLLHELRSWLWFFIEITVIIAGALFITNSSKKNFVDIYTPFDRNMSSLYDIKEIRSIPNINETLLTCLYYTPRNNFTEKIMIAVSNALNFSSPKYFSNEELLELSFTGEHCLAGIEFYDTNDIIIPNKLSFALRFPSDFRTINKQFDTYKNYWMTRCSGVLETKPKFYPQNDCLYLREGFLQLQHRIFLEWLHLLDISETSIPKIEIRSIRHGDSSKMCFMSYINYNWFLYLFLYIIPFINLLRRYGREVEENIFTHHSLYGVENYYHWLAHFIISFGHFLILNSVLIFIKGINWGKQSEFENEGEEEASALLFFLHLTLCSISMILFAMNLISIFRNVTNTILFTVAIWIISNSMIVSGITISTPMSLSVIIYLSLFSFNIIPYGMNLLYLWDEDAKWKFIILIIFIIVYCLLLIIILSAINCILLYENRDRPRFKLFRSKSKTESIKYFGPSISNWANLQFSSFDAIQVLHLKHVYTFRDNKNVNPQLKDITIHILKGEITVILGPYNSGKTTLLRVMAGWRKYNGSIYCSFNTQIYNNPQEYKHLVDVTLMHNPLFDLFTVRESLKYFIHMKENERNPEKCKSEIFKWLNFLKLANINQHNVVKNLSFEQKRLLSLCCILCNDTPIVLLDEPTEYMRTEEQAIYWHILKQEKSNRVIILSTFHVDIADQLGDRIGIMYDGCLLACGTPLFLKTKFTKNYSLIIIRDINQPHTSITELIKKHIPSATIVNEIGDKMVYNIPADRKHIFQKLLLNLENNGPKIGIKNIAMLNDELKDVYKNLSEKNTQIRTLPDIKRFTHFRRNSKSDIIRSQIAAILYKKMINQAPSIIPVIMVALVFIIVILLHELTNHMIAINDIDKGIELGFDLAEKSRKLIQKQWDKSCKYIEIKHAEITKSETFTEALAKYFMYKEFSCEKMPYEVSLSNHIYHDKLSAVEFVNSDNFLIWFNQRVFHTAPLALNLAQNLILSKLFPNMTEYLIITANKPLSIPLIVLLDFIDNQVFYLRVPLTIGIIIPFIMATFIIILVEENKIEFYLLQKIAGLHMAIYWLINFLWDFCTFFIYSIFFLIVMMFSTIEGFGLIPKMLTVFLMNIHCIPTLLLIYLMSSLSGKRSKSYLIVVNMQLLFGVFLFICYWYFLNRIPILYNLLMLLPTFALLEGISKIYLSVKEQELCENRCQIYPGCKTNNICEYFPNCCHDTFFKWHTPGILPVLTSLIGSSILLVLLFIVAQWLRNSPNYYFRSKIKDKISGYYLYEDDDIIQNKIKISSMTRNQIGQYNVVVDQLESNIQKTKKTNILSTMSFAVSGRSCFGIFGGNKSGKTNLVKKLVGGSRILFGEVYICETNIKTQLSLAQENIGYCPQQNAMPEAFTPSQLFTFFYKIHGLSSDIIRERVRELSMHLNLQGHMNKKISSLPYFIRRRLNIAVAFIFQNTVLIFDDPTKGLSIPDKLLIWNLLRNACLRGNSVIFTTDESFECDFLADDMVMMWDGNLLAIGSPHYLRLKLTLGFFLEVKIRLDGTNDEEIRKNLHIDIENVSRYMTFLSENSELIYVNGNFLFYYLPVEKVIYSYLLGSLEKNYRRLNIVNYVIKQASLQNALQNIKEANIQKRHYIRLSNY